MTRHFPPQRIVCLTEETVETLYALGAEERIVGVSGYAVRPKRVRREKPRVSAFISADIDKILALEPDLVLTFSDLQADIAAALIRAHVAVHAFNQRDIAGILAMVRMLGALIGEAERGAALADGYAARIADVAARCVTRTPKPKIYFEEWNEPMITGIGWVSELIGIAGGIDVFAHKSTGRHAMQRTVTANEVVAASPDIIVGSWCGKKFVPDKVAARPAFATVPAVRTRQLYEIKSPLILQPGPAALTDGLDAMVAIFDRWAETVAQESQPGGSSSLSPLGRELG
ncbi:MAG TPA: cobalamin-binding protein [Xanthobacteraceae bacterium]|nr:cobalamin-binding protein [Xanthobacteraceae bacterium]